jgi:putative Ca2+/H+ antiporter (TMEM165/GDT1 family)
LFVIFFATFGAVLLAEIVGDKLLYTTGLLAARYRTAPIMIGMAAAFMSKMGVAVLIGGAISKLPRLLVAGITAISFIGVAVTLWRKDDQYRHERDKHKAHKAAMVSFAAIFFSEWGDVGQITAAGISARSTTLAIASGIAGATWRIPLIVWLGAVSAMVTKGMLAAFLGAGIRRWIHDRVSPKIVRYVAVGLLLVLGVLSVLEILMTERT